ncbi:MAG TPA: ATP-binding protein [Kofleriaceae bacterium]|nr:ATP-binding protein [Kofleriaceae bacterium]
MPRSVAPGDGAPRRPGAAAVRADPHGVGSPRVRAQAGAGDRPGRGRGVDLRCRHPGRAGHHRARRRSRPGAARRPRSAVAGAEQPAHQRLEVQPARPGRDPHRSARRRQVGSNRGRRSRARHRQGRAGAHLRDVRARFGGGAQRHSGSGLGLAIVRAIVRGNRGKIDLHSEPGKGTRFELRLRRVLP